jgi:hypothetical protein
MVANCVFSDPLPDELIYFITTNNFVGTHTSTVLYNYLDTEWCQAALPLATVAASPAATEVAPGTATGAASPVATQVFTIGRMPKQELPRMVWTALLFQFIVPV